MLRQILGLLFTFAILAAPTTVNSAQSAATAAIVGAVIDPEGAVVADCTVVARNVETGIERTTKTSSEGLYRFDHLSSGIYDVLVESHAGFAAAKATAIKLQVGEQRDVNFTLSVARAIGEVTITSELPLVETTKTDFSTVVTDKQVAVLPTTTSFSNNGGVANDYAGLATIAPGIKYDTTIFRDLLSPGAVNNRGIQVNIDGGNISSQAVSTRNALGCSVEEVKEFQVLSNNYNAEYGQAGGLILNVITRSGTNEFHGDAHYYTRGRNLTASTYFFNQTNEARFRRAPFHKFEGGGTAGGPIIKNRTFWFVGYEQTRQEVPLTLVPPGASITVPQPTRELLYSGKIDHRLTKNNFLTARYNVQRGLQENMLPLASRVATPESLVGSFVHDNMLNISKTWTIRPTVVNEFRLFWHRVLTQTQTKSDMPGQQGPNFYHGAASCCPQGALHKRYQFIDNLSWMRGTHTIKTGFNISHLPAFLLFKQLAHGLYIYSRPEPDRGPATFFTIGLGSGQVNATNNIYGFYVQDTWKIRPNVTLNLGLRYEVEDGAFKGGSVKGGPSGCTQGNGIIPACSSDRNNFQPRFGLAWSPRFNGRFLRTLFGGPDQTVIRLSLAEITMLVFLNIPLNSLNFDGVNFLTVNSLRNPAVLAFAPNRPPDSVLDTLRPVNFFGAVRPISSDLRNPESRHLNFTISRQFGDNFVLDLSYLGVFGYGLFGEYDRNYPTIKQDPAHPGFFYLANRPDPRFDAVRTTESTRTSGYNGFLVSAKKRLSRGFQFQGGYTFSKLLTTAEDFFGLSEPGDPRNVRADRSRASNDVRHQLNFGAVYDIGRPSDHALLKHVVNNWAIGVIGRLESGRPYPISTGDGPFSGSVFFGAGRETVQRPNILPDGTLSTTNIAGIGRRAGNLLIGPGGHAVCPLCPQTTFLAPADASSLGPRDSLTGQLVDFQFLNGNLERNAGQTSPFYRFDMSFIKAFPIPGHERMSLELKVDFFNNFNRANFLLFNGHPNLNELPISTDPNCRLCLNATNGRYIGADGRVLKIQDLKQGFSRDLKNMLFGRVGNPTATDIPRTIQLSGRCRR